MLQSTHYSIMPLLTLNYSKHAIHKLKLNLQAISNTLIGHNMYYILS